LKLDLGCGGSKHPDFFGIDRHPRDGVDLVWDINNGIPLPDQSVEWVMACRILPYVHDLQAVLSEIYRVSIHKAVVCILAPYAHSFRHASNPQLRHRFDEHTPRYFTKHFYQPLQGPVSPNASIYAESEDIPYDLRLIRMEYFYHDVFRTPMYESEELENLLQLQANVVDEIMYHFVVVKEEIAEYELEQLSRQNHLEPEHTQELRRITAVVESLEEEVEPIIQEAAAALRPGPFKRSSVLRGHHKKLPRFSRNQKKRSRYSP
jgi:ubiquinone/menaquinone biosynthesis C-methylase UbiE